MHDLRDAIRHIVHRPAHAAAIALTLALGIGANAAVFSVVHSVLIKTLPFPRSEQLVNVWQTQPGNNTRRVAPANFIDWRQAASFDGLAAYDVRRRSLMGDEPERITVAAVSSNFFPVLGTGAVIGQTFTQPLAIGSVRGLILRDDLWRRKFGADPGIIGRAIVLDDQTVTVTGVIERTKGFPEDAVAWMQAWDDVPELSGGAPANIRILRDARYLRVLGRLKSGTTMRQAQTELDAIAARLREAHPDANADTGVNVVSLKEQLTGASKQTLWILFAVVGCVLAIACGNVAALFLAALLGRARELRLRTALGASGPRLVRQLTVESLLLAMGGSLLGLVLSWTLRPALIAVLPADIPRLASVEIDSAVFVFTLLTGVAVTIACGVIPGVIAVRTASAARLREGGRSGHSRQTTWVASALMTIQLTLALVLATGTGLMLRTLWTLYARDPGIDVGRLLALDVTIPDAKSRGRVSAAHDIARIIERIAVLPDVTGVAAIQALPLSGSGPSANIRVDGRSFAAAEAPDVSWRTVTPSYFQTAGISILRGRGFTEQDRNGSSPVAVINATLARRLWPGDDPLGKRIGTGLDGNGAPVVIVGIAADVPQEGIAAAVQPEIFRPLAQPSRFTVDAMSIIVRTNGNPSHLSSAVREAIREIHPQAPVSGIRPMSVVAAASVGRELTAARALAVFGGLSLLLAAVGLHGVMTRLINDRRRELGVRIALGADPRNVRWLVMSRTLRLAFAGTVAGIGASLLLARQLKALLHRTPPADPLVLFGASVLLLAVAIVSTYGPARRASTIDPMEVMKTE